MFSILTLNNPIFADNSRNGTVNKKYLRLRLRPNTKSEVKETLKRNDKVTVLERSGKWFKIQTSFNQGWVKSKYISSSYYTTDTLAETDKDIFYGNKTDSVTNSSIATISMKTTSINSNVTSNNSKITTSNNSKITSSNSTVVNGTSEKSNKVLPKMNNTASKNKVQEVSNERNKYNNRDEDY